MSLVLLVHVNKMKERKEEEKKMEARLKSQEDKVRKNKTLTLIIKVFLVNLSQI